MSDAGLLIPSLSCRGVRQRYFPLYGFEYINIFTEVSLLFSY
ncbi:hypothetical protein HMPREF0758_0217 [Serratia odorifera DSM 4582]|uniref:Uncharacterized protein n=1 Tax=Serratia odorifera DSM 4582 TaxID=667129 RepID=D4DWB7_SEROD|nr:hypothetical protein HMPREF0758_0217 [Serratia odorifera DSM 4582]